MPSDPGLAAPVDVENMGGTMSPRHSPTTRTHEREIEEELDAKGARLADSKKQRINAITSQNAHMTRVVKFGAEEYNTMDDYDSGVKQDECNGDGIDLWAGEEEILVAGVPEALWHDGSLDEQPPSPEQLVEDLADKVEIGRLLDMGVLKRFADYEGEISGRLTTRFVRDWRQKLYVGDGDSRVRWMRRSRYVAREFANEKRDGVFAPTTGAHSNNLLLVSFFSWLMLQKIKVLLTDPCWLQWTLVMRFYRLTKNVQSNANFKDVNMSSSRTSLDKDLEHGPGTGTSETISRKKPV